MTEWEEVSIPLIEYVWDREQAGAVMLEVRNIADHLGQDPDRTDAAVRRLYDNGWISGANLESGSAASLSILIQPRVGARGMRAIVQWPTDDPMKELLAVLTRRAEEEDDPEERSKWLALVEKVTDIGSSALGAVLAEFLKRSAGMV